MRKFGDEDRYELAHEVMVAKVWQWVGVDDLRLLDVRDMLRRAMSDYGTFGHLLDVGKLALLDGYRDALALEAGELELLFRSALAAGHETNAWFDRACAAGVAADAIALEGLGSDAFRTRAAAVAALSRLGEYFADALIPMLADPYPQVRAAAIAGLERLRPDGVWRKQLKYECYVPAGEFVMGDDKGYNEKPAHRVALDAFYIGKYPVTNAEYARFMADRGRGFDMPAGKENHPVVNVSWYDAHDYAAWAEMRLPTEAEWEKAASWEPEDKETRGPGDKGRKRVYPWGDTFDKNKCNTSESGIGTATPVGKYSPAGDSPCGCADMAGNVWEWCNDWYAEGVYREQARGVPRNPAGPRDGVGKVLRGGSYWGNSNGVRCAFRGWLDPGHWVGDLGFRVARGPR